LDVASIDPGLDFEAALASTLDRAQVLLALIGKTWLTAQDPAGRRRIDLETDWVRAELARALDRGIRVIPVLVDGAEMPNPEFLPSALSNLSKRQTLSVTFEEHERGIESLLGILAKTCDVPFVTSPYEAVAPLSSTQPSATAVLGVFEEGSTDNETLTVLAELQLDRGRFALARSIFELVASREFRQRNGPPEIDALRARYQVARASLLLGDSESAARDLDFILPYYRPGARPELPSVHKESGGSRAGASRTGQHRSRASGIATLARNTLPRSESDRGRCLDSPHRREPFVSG
jgi:hypothetical protein